MPTSPTSFFANYHQRLLAAKNPFKFPPSLPSFRLFPFILVKNISVCLVDLFPASWVEKLELPTQKAPPPDCLIEARGRGRWVPGLQTNDLNCPNNGDGTLGRASAWLSKWSGASLALNSPNPSQTQHWCRGQSFRKPDIPNNPEHSHCKKRGHKKPWIWICPTALCTNMDPR